MNVEWLYIPVYQKRASYPLVLGFFILYGCSYRSVTMSHTVNTTWISSVDFKTWPKHIIKGWSIFNHLNVPVDLAITIAQSQPHTNQCLVVKSRLGNRMFFSKKIVVAIVMFNRVLQIDPISKLRLFFASRNTTSCCPHFLNAPFYYQMMPWTKPHHLTPFDLWPNTVECIRPLIVSFYLFYETHSNSW